MSERSEGTDDQLVARVRSGDHQAVALLRRRHHRAVRRVAVSLLGEDGPVDEVVSEAFARVLARVLAGPGDLAFRASLVLAVRRAAETRRRAGRPAAIGDGASPSPGAYGLVGEGPGGGPAADPLAAAAAAAAAVAAAPAAPAAAAPTSPLRPGDPAARLTSRRAPAPVSPGWARRAAVRRHLVDEHDDTCRAVVARLDAYVAGELHAAEEEQLGDHLAECPRCQGLEIELVETRPSREVLVPVLLVLGALAALLVPGRFAPAGGPTEGPVTSVEMAVSSVPQTTTTTRPPTTTTDPPAPPPPASTPPDPAEPPAPTTSAPGEAPGPTAPGDAADEDEAVPAGTAPAPPAGPGPAPGLGAGQDLLLAEDPQPGAPVVDGAPSARLTLDAGPLTVSVVSGLSRTAPSPVRFTVANPGGATGPVRLRVAPEAGVSLWVQPIDQATCPSDGAEVECRWDGPLGPSATVHAQAPMLPGRTAPVALAVVVEVDGAVVGSGSLLLPVS